MSRKSYFIDTEEEGYTVGSYKEEEEGEYSYPFHRDEKFGTFSTEGEAIEYIKSEFNGNFVVLDTEEEIKIYIDKAEDGTIINMEFEFRYDEYQDYMRRWDDSFSDEDAI